jgi:hypothetical protein
MFDMRWAARGFKLRNPETKTPWHILEHILGYHLHKKLLEVEHLHVNPQFSSFNLEVSINHFLFKPVDRTNFTKNISVNNRLT